MNLAQSVIDNFSDRSLIWGYIGDELFDMYREVGKVVYPARFSLEGECYSIYFPDFGVTGNGFSDLDETIDFASNLLGEIVIDYVSKGLQLPSRSEITDNEDNTYKNIVIDADFYAHKAEENRKRLFYEQEELAATDVFEKKTIQKHYINGVTKKKTIAIILAAVLLLASIGVISSISERREEERRQAQKEAEMILVDEYIQQARTDIKQEKYNTALEELDKIPNAIEIADTNYRLSERDTLYSYSKLLSLRNDSSSITDQYELLDKIQFSETDEFHDDYYAVKADVEKEYSYERLIEEVQASGTERKRREKLAKSLPYEGMSEEDISCTAVGAYSVKHYNLIFRPYGFEGCDIIYDWNTALPVNHSSIVTLEVGVDDGVVMAVRKDMELWAWDDDTPLFLEDVYNAKEKDLEFDKDDKYNVYDYLTGVDFANSKQDVFLENVLSEYKKSGKYDHEDLREISFTDLAWNRAFDYWLNKQVYMEDDEEIEQKATEELFRDTDN